jgi:hypothetical protein
MIDGGKILQWDPLIKDMDIEAKCNSPAQEFNEILAKMFERPEDEIPEERKYQAKV